MSRFLGGLLQKAQGIKAKAEEVKKELKSKRVEAEENGIKVTATGDRKLVSIEIAPEIQLSQEELKEQILKVSNLALSKAGELQKEAAGKAMAEIGLNLPEIF